MSSTPKHRPLLVQHYDLYLANQDIGVFVRRVLQKYTIGALERLAQSGDRTARRAAVLALGQTAEYSSNAVLGRALIDADRGVRTLAENSIRRVWMRVGTQYQRRRLAAIDQRLADKDFPGASQLATVLVQEAPWIAEVWYQRGRAYFQLGQFEAASRDCHQALEINAYHFPAASTMGQAYLRLGDQPLALESYRRALRLNPSMEEVRAQVIQLQRSLKEKP
ncbi:MAG: tetratricopeptide repeat protein [Planctomycetota bacterium]